MFLAIDQREPSRVAMREDDGRTLTYGQLADFTREWGSLIPARSIVFVLCETTIAAVAGFVGSIENRIVPLMLPASLDQDQLKGLIDTYEPGYLWAPDEIAPRLSGTPAWNWGGYTLLATGYEAYPLYEDLALLLTTSGSTGSPKLVRHCYGNVNATARNVARAFELGEDERPLISLPVNFTQGLSTVTSNLLSGGELLLTKANMMQPQFWALLKEATSITGVPYSYEVLCKMRFLQSDWPNLRIINEGGGKLPTQRFQDIAEYAQRLGKRFIATYGATETTSRMAYLPPELALEKTCSIGRPLPEGTIRILDDEGNEVPQGQVGELVYSGPNVTLGYAQCKEDLLKGDERHGVYATGDLAVCDKDGCHTITGRKSRFLKIFGFRIGLDETELMVKDAFDTDCACVGTDKKMIIYVPEALTQRAAPEEVVTYLAERTKMRPAAFEVRAIEAIPKNDTGKTQYQALAVE